MKKSIKLSILIFCSSLFTFAIYNKANAQSSASKSNSEVAKEEMVPVHPTSANYPSASPLSDPATEQPLKLMPVNFNGTPQNTGIVSTTTMPTLSVVNKEQLENANKRKIEIDKCLENPQNKNLFTDEAAKFYNAGDYIKAYQLIFGEGNSKNTPLNNLKK